MSSNDRRDAARTPCQVPVRLSWDNRAVDATAIDVSRGGARLLIPARAVVDQPGASVATLARQLCETLPSRLPTFFHPDLLGPLVQRTLTVVRVGVQAGEEPAIELGCRVSPSLQEVDAAAMGVALARPGETVSEARRRHTPSAPRVRRTSPEDPLASSPGPHAFDEPPSFVRRSVAKLVSEEEEGARVITGYTESVDGTGVVVLVPQRSRLGLSLEEESVSTLFAELCDSHGSLFRMTVRDASRTVWSGGVRLRSLEVLPHNPDAVLLGFAFVPRRPPVDTPTAASV